MSIKRERKITFPNVGIEQGSRVWRNAETGVEIIKGKNFAANGLYYVCIPAAPKEMCGPDGRRIVASQSSLAAARLCALGYAYTGRAAIAEAYIEAHLEEEKRDNQRLMREGVAIREANQREQIEAWCARHDIVLSFDSAPDILAAREFDHEEALTENEFATRFGTERLTTPAAPSVIGKTLGDLAGEVPGGLCVRDAAGMQWVTMNPTEHEPREPGYVLFTARKPMLRLDVQHWEIIADYRPSRHWR